MSSDPSTPDSTSPKSPAPRKGWSGGLPYFILSGALAILAILLFTRVIDLNPPPEAAPGRNQVINVVQALEGEGLTVTMDPSIYAPVGTFSAPGQGLLVNDTPVLVFVFPSSQLAAKEAGEVDPAEIFPAKVLPPGPTVSVIQSSNIVVAIPDTDPALVSTVTTAVDTLS